MSTIHLYAEHLQNIHTVSFTAILASYHTDETSAELSADGEYISLTHEGERASIRLPVRIKGGGSATLALPKSPAKELTLRLQLEEKDGMRLLQDILTNDRENLVPWNASELERWKGVSCKNCGNLVAGHDGVRSESEVVADTKDGSITSWRDLPNENWAEMMDFWHCHKPEHQHHALAHSSDKDGNGKLESESVLTKGYAANNKLCASKGVGYVGLGFLLFAEEDCGGIEVGLNLLQFVHSSAILATSPSPRGKKPRLKGHLEGGPTKSMVRLPILPVQDQTQDLCQPSQGTCFWTGSLGLVVAQVGGHSFQTLCRVKNFFVRRMM